MAVITRCLLSKNDLAGWEVMELFAGGVNQSDKFFNVITFLRDRLVHIHAFLTKVPITLGICHHPKNVAWR